MGLSNLAASNEGLDELDESIGQFIRANQIFSKFGDDQSVAYNEINIGECSLNLKRWLDAQRYLASAARTLKALGDDYGLLMALIRMGRLQYEQGRFAEALAVSETGLELSRRISSVESELEILDYEWMALRAVGRTSEAWYSLNRRTYLSDSLVESNGERDIVRMEIRSAFEKQSISDSLRRAFLVTRSKQSARAARIEARGHRDTFNVIVSIGLPMLFLGGAFVGLDRRRRKHRHTRKAAQLQTQVWRSQINPHFIRTALQNINDYVQANERDLASSFLTRFARLMRAVLENARKDEVSLASDLAVMRDYLELEKVRSNAGFQYEIVVDPAVEMEEVMVPPMLLQPFAEEAIWKRLAQKVGPGHLTVRIQQQGSALVLSIEDDGIAKQPIAEGGLPSEDVDGTMITRSRLDFLAKQEGKAASVQVIPLAAGQRVELILPLLTAA